MKKYLSKKGVLYGMIIAEIDFEINNRNRGIYNEYELS